MLLYNLHHGTYNRPLFREQRLVFADTEQPNQIDDAGAEEEQTESTKRVDAEKQAEDLRKDLKAGEEKIKEKFNNIPPEVQANAAKNAENYKETQEEGESEIERASIERLDKLKKILSMTLADIDKVANKYTKTAEKEISNESIAADLEGVSDRNEMRVIFHLQLHRIIEPVLHEEFDNVDDKQKEAMNQLLSKSLQSYTEKIDTRLIQENSQNTLIYLIAEATSKLKSEIEKEQTELDKEGDKEKKIVFSLSKHLDKYIEKEKKAGKLNEEEITKVKDQLNKVATTPKEVTAEPTSEKPTEKGKTKETKEENSFMEAIKKIMAVYTAFTSGKSWEYCRGLWEDKTEKDMKEEDKINLDKYLKDKKFDADGLIGVIKNPAEHAGNVKTYMGMAAIREAASDKLGKMYAKKEPAELAKGLKDFDAFQFGGRTSLSQELKVLYEGADFGFAPSENGKKANLVAMYKEKQIIFKDGKASHKGLSADVGETWKETFANIDSSIINKITDAEKVEEENQAEKAKNIEEAEKALSEIKLDTEGAEANIRTYITLLMAEKEGEWFKGPDGVELSVDKDNPNSPIYIKEGDKVQMLLEGNTFQNYSSGEKTEMDKMYTDDIKKTPFLKNWMEGKPDKEYSADQWHKVGEFEFKYHKGMIFSRQVEAKIPTEILEGLVANKHKELGRNLYEQEYENFVREEQENYQKTRIGRIYVHRGPAIIADNAKVTPEQREKILSQFPFLK